MSDKLEKARQDVQEARKAYNNDCGEHSPPPSYSDSAERYESARRRLNEEYDSDDGWYTGP